MDHQQTQPGTPQAGGPSQLPAGFTVDSTPYSPQQASSELPAGYTVDSTPQQAPNQTALQKMTSGLENEDNSTSTPWTGAPQREALSGAIKSGAGGLGNILDMLNHPLRTSSMASKLAAVPSAGASLVAQQAQIKSLTDSYRQAHPDATDAQVQQFMQQQMNQPLSTHIQDAVDWLRSGGEPKGFWQHVGSLGEQALEWIGTDGIAKMASAPAMAVEAGKAVEAIDTVAHAKQTAQVAATLKANPKLAGLVTLGLKASKDALGYGVGNAAQTLVHTENPDEALHAGITGGLTAGILGAGGSALEQLSSKGGEAANTVDELRQTAENAPTGTQVNDQLSNSIDQAVAPEKEAAQQSLQEAEGGLANAAQSPQDLGIGAPESAAITSQAQKAAQDAYAKLGTNYENSLNGITGKLEGTTVEYPGSPLHQAAQEIMGTAAQNQDEIGSALNIPNPASPKATNLVKTLADDEGTLGIDDEGNPKQLSADQLLSYAKQLKENLRKTGWATEEQRADRDVYHQLLDGVHETLDNLAQKHIANNPVENDAAGQSVLGAVKKMNSDYKEGITRFKNPDVQALLRGDSDNVAKRLMGGGTSVKDINTVRDAIGKDSFGKLADSSLQRMSADAVDASTGEFSFKKFLTNWNRIPPATRNAMFQDSTKSGALEQALYQAQAINKSGAIPEATERLKNVTDTVSSLLGNGDVTSLLKDPERVQNLAQTLGPDGMQSLGTSILQNQIREASTDALGKVKNSDVSKVLGFITSLKDSPEVVDALFKPTQESAQAYNKLIDQLHNVQSVKNAIKIGVIAPTASIGVSFGTIPAIIGGLAAIGEGGTATGRALLEKISNSPTSWKLLKGIDNAVKSPLAKGAGSVLQYVGSKAAVGATSSQQDVYSGASDALGGK